MLTKEVKNTTQIQMLPQNLYPEELNHNTMFGRYELNTHHSEAIYFTYVIFPSRIYK